MRSLSLVIAIAALMGCSTPAVIIDYKAPEDSSADWYPIPADAPTQVEVRDIDVQPAKTVVADIAESDADSQLVLTRQQDSLGNSTLLFNRQAALSWVLVESALAELDYDLSDKDRENYRFELTPIREDSSLMAMLFGKPPEALNIILIPQGSSTMLVVEGEGDELPDVKRIESILDDLQDHLQPQG